MKRIVAALLLVAAVMGASSRSVLADGSSQDARPVIYIVNQSHVPQWKVNQYLPVFQDMIDKDLTPVWMVTARLEASQTPPYGSMQITLKDGLRVWGAAGFHAVSLDKHVPYAVVDTKLDQGDFAWSEILTHELQEMMVDPYIDRMSGVIRCPQRLFAKCGTRVFYYVEVSDAVEASRYAYTRYTASGKPVRISDFVTPAWYSNRANGPYDYTGYVHRHHQVLPGGYIYYCKAGDWDAIKNWSFRIKNGVK